MSTVTIYTIRDGDDYELGRPARQVLSNPLGLVDSTWVTAAEYQLPDGYALDINGCNQPIITRNDQTCDLLSGKDDRPVIQYTDLRQYAPRRERTPLVKIRDVDLAD